MSKCHESQFYATLRQITGGKHVEVTRTDGTRIRDVLTELTMRYPPLKAELFNEEGELHNYVHVFVNGRDIRYMATLMDTLLKETDEVDLFPAVGGG
ncbi:MAG: MoaD/ThiS family protein [Anaerolineae bacterium]|nr:MoaD/ThiS family protein [Anaerolineae bacterium]